jgi:predicted PurR-regulated permease PerM
MLRAIEGFGVLFLLSAFFAYVLAPAVAAVQRRVRLRPRQRPLSRAGALALIYLLLFVPGALGWRASRGAVEHWVRVTAPESVDRLFGGSGASPLDAFLRRLPVGAEARAAALSRGEAGIDYVEREARATLGDMIEAARYAPWLIAVPVIAFVLLTSAPAFQRSALRVLPRGHLQWRGEEYFRDVNSALAGYIRAQSAAAVIVGLACVAGFLVIGLPGAVSTGVAAGILELVPAIGPLTALLIASAQAGHRLIAVLLFLGLLRLVQDYVIYPRLIRHGMHLSTPAVIVTIWIGAVFAGAAGVILAIPVAGLLSVSWRHWREFREIERLVRSASRPPGEAVAAADSLPAEETNPLG